MKIGIVSPARDMVHTGYAFDCMNMAGFTISSRPEIIIGAYCSMGTMIFDQRIKLVRACLADGCDYIMWLDTDMRFPKETLLRLLAHCEANPDVKIVAANYVTRQVPPEPVSFTLTDDGKLWRRVPTLADSTGLEKVTGAPMGVMLCDMKVFKAIDKPDVPMFWFQYSVKNHTVLGEDIYFCINAGRYGFGIYIDHDLSKEVKHCGTFEFGHEHVEDIAASNMRKELDAAQVTDLNMAYSAPTGADNQGRSIPEPPPKVAPVAPLAKDANGKWPEVYQGAEGMHRNEIRRAMTEAAE
jgi:hypothetical protein